MRFEIGKIIDYDNFVGTILSVKGEKYMFLKEDLQEDINNLKDNLVIFRPEIIIDLKRAFYIQNLGNIKKNKKIRTKIFEKISLNYNIE